MQPFMLIHGDARDRLRAMPDNSVDSIVTDPPYELNLMAKDWDRTEVAFDPAIWTECLRVLKPGGHLLAFGGARTCHRMVCAIEDAGFVIRDQIIWIFGSGMPKGGRWTKEKAARGDIVSARMIEAGYGGWARGGLKPAHEPICVARKMPIGPIGENMQQFGVGALNIDSCRVESELVDLTGDDVGQLGRWPANVIRDDSEVVAALFPSAPGPKGDVRGTESSASRSNVYNVTQRRSFSRHANGDASAARRYNNSPADFSATPGDRRFDVGSAARFFYCAKASSRDRHEGLVDPGPQFKRGVTLRQIENLNKRRATKGNVHPTVKPTTLMSHLCRLVTPSGGIVLDPFAGSGSTGKAAVREGYRFIGIELQSEFVEIARMRITFEWMRMLSRRKAA